MPDLNLGRKHHCPECEKKFYDLGRSQVVCPGCGHQLDAAEAKVAAATEKVILEADLDVAKEDTKAAKKSSSGEDDEDVDGKGEDHEDDL